MCIRDRIDEIQVENLALIRKATLEPARGLTVLTGETGAGKTALLSALKLLMGERADKGSVRDGEDALVVSGRFFGVASLEDAGDGEDAELVACLLYTSCMMADAVAVSCSMSARFWLGSSVLPSTVM